MAKHPYDTYLGGLGRQFPQTEWTRLQDKEKREAALTEMCRTYWKPVYSYLRAIGYKNEQAKDLVQGFFTDKILGQNLIQKADRSKGRFRNFVLRSVQNYAISVQRKRKPCVSLDQDLEDSHATKGPEAEFNRAWANDLLQEVLKELELECHQRGKEIHWNLFRDWLLEPQIEQTKRMKDVCLQYNIENTSQAYHMIENIKRRFQKLLRSHLSPQTTASTEAEAEIREFISVFSCG